MLDKELDKLRDKTLSFGCVVECENKYSYILSYHVNRNENQIKSIDGFVYKLLSINQFGENIHSDYNNLNGYNIIGHPLVYGRIYGLSYKLRNTKSGKVADEILYNKTDIERILKENDLIDKSELERQTHEKRPELKALLMQFTNYL